MWTLEQSRLMVRVALPSDGKDICDATGIARTCEVILRVVAGCNNGDAVEVINIVMWSEAGTRMSIWRTE